MEPWKSLCDIGAVSGDLGVTTRQSPLESFCASSPGGIHPQTSTNASGSAPDPRRKPASSQRCDRGTITSTLTSVHPYAQVSINDDVDAWAIGGYGTGNMTIDHTACEAFKTAIGMTMAAAGVRGQVLSTDAGDALDSTVRTDMLWLRASSDRTERMLAAEADVRRLRLMIDAGRGFAAGAGTLTPTIEAGIRHDAGDAEEGLGLEVGASLAYAAKTGGVVQDHAEAVLDVVDQAMRTNTRVTTMDLAEWAEGSMHRHSPLSAEYSNGEALGLVEHMRRRGILHLTAEGRAEVPIPSLRTWLMGPYAAHIGWTPDRRGNKRPPAGPEAR